MGRSGIAMTFVTDQELEDLRSLLKTNRIDPVWHGHIPNLEAVPRPRRQGKRTFKKQPLPVARSRALSHKKNVVSTPSPFQISAP